MKKLFRVQEKMVSNSANGEEALTFETLQAARAAGLSLRSDLNQLRADVAECKQTIGDPNCIIC
jgi:hypothetical protein